MPTTEQILFKLVETVNSWKWVAVLWHVVFVVVAVALASGFKPSRRLAGVFLAAMLLSVSVIAWLTRNPFNGIVYALAALTVAAIGLRLSRKRVSLGPRWAYVPGVFFVVAGWTYPHFLDATSFIHYLYAAPTGLVPCPTLIMVIGLTLIAGGLGSRALPSVLGVIGVFYGVTGVFQLKVALDWILVAAALLVLVLPFVPSLSARE